MRTLTSRALAAPTASQDADPRHWPRWMRVTIILAFLMGLMTGCEEERALADKRVRDRCRAAMATKFTAFDSLSSVLTEPRSGASLDCLDVWRADFIASLTPVVEDTTMVVEVPQTWADSMLKGYVP